MGICSKIFRKLICYNILMKEKPVKKIKRNKKNKKIKKHTATNSNVNNININVGGKGGNGKSRKGNAKSGSGSGSGKGGGGGGGGGPETSSTITQGPVVSTPHDTTRFQTRSLLTDGVQGNKRLDGSIESATIKQNLLIKDVTDANNLLIKENQQIKSNLLTLASRVIKQEERMSPEDNSDNTKSAVIIEDVDDIDEPATPKQPLAQYDNDGKLIIRRQDGTIKKRPGPKPGAKKLKEEAAKAEAAKAEAEAAMATAAPESVEPEKNEYDDIRPIKLPKVKLTRRVIKTNNYESPNIPTVSRLTGEGMETRSMTRNIPESVPDDERKPSGDEPAEEPAEEPEDNPNVFG
jgi:hypothetical protein